MRYKPAMSTSRWDEAPGDYATFKLGSWDGPLCVELFGVDIGWRY